jgi:hypothetical protein
MSDGRFIGILDENSPSTGVIRTIEVVLNWLEELKTRVPIR